MAQRWTLPRRRGGVKDPRSGPGPILDAAPQTGEAWAEPLGGTQEPVARGPIPTAPSQAEAPQQRGPWPLPVHQAAVELGPLLPPPRQRRAPQQGLDPLHQTAGEEATGHLIAGMDERGAMPRAPAGLPAVKQPPAFAPLLKQHQGRGARPWHQQHPPTDAPLLLIEQHLNGGEITGKGIGHGHGAKDPPSRRPRARAGDGPSSGALLGNGCWWRPACAALARGPQHGKGRGADFRRNLGAGGDGLGVLHQSGLHCPCRSATSRWARAWVPRPIACGKS